MGLGLIVLFRWMALDGTYRSTRRRIRAAQVHANRFILPEDLDYPCQRLLRRAQNAVEAIMASRVHRTA